MFYSAKRHRTEVSRRRNMARPIILGIALICISTACAAAATITAAPCGEKCLLPSYPNVTITLTGRIEKGDFASLQKQYAAPAQFICLDRIESGRYVMMTPGEYGAWQKTHQAQTSDANQPSPNRAAEKQCSNGAIPNRPGYMNGMLLINSAGGDLDEAMAIGRWIRQNRLGVAARGDCASACVWILAAGLIRDVWSYTKLRIHRPYFTTNRPEAGENLQVVLQRSKAYFEEMGVPSELAERMFSTPPDEATSLSSEQISYYRLNQPELGFQEELDFVRAEKLGVSREEYSRRMQIYNEWNSRTPCPLDSVDQKDTASYLKCLNERARKVGIER
jgi:hypothetical protein